MKRKQMLLALIGILSAAVLAITVSQYKVSVDWDLEDSDFNKRMSEWCEG